MLTKVKKIIFLASFFAFIFFSVNFYLSEENIIQTNKSRSSYAYELSNNNQSLPLLENDTNNIIEFTNDMEKFKKNKKNYTFWDLIGK